MFITNKEISKITSALTRTSIQPEEWALIYLILIDLGLSSKKLKEIKEIKSSNEISDFEAISSLLKYLFDCYKDATVFLNDLIAAFKTNIEKFPGFVKQDYVLVLNEVRKDLEFVEYHYVPMEKAFSIDLIRGEIYKHLTKIEKRNLRLTSKSILELTLKNWRNTMRLTIGPGNNTTVSMKEFYERYLKSENPATSKKDYCLLNLAEIPFKSYHFWKETISPFKSEWNKWDELFLTKCGPQITSLSLRDCTYYLYCFIPTYIWLVTVGCPKIERLDIQSFQELRHGPVNTKPRRKNAKNQELFNYHEIKTQRGKQERLNVQIGSCDTLKALKIHKEASVTYERDCNLLAITPNLKELTANEPIFLKGVLQAVPCKLETLQIDMDRFQDKKFEPLHTYTKEHPVKHIHLSGIDLSDWRHEDYEPSCILKSISNCSSASLVSLQLEFRNYFQFQVEQFLIDDLPKMKFPLLKTFTIIFPSKKVNFDLGTLVNTPNLEMLNIKSAVEEEREHPWMENWFKNKEIPDDFSVPKFKQFCFDGWPVSYKVLELFKNWFPLLHHLTVGLGKCTKTSPDFILRTLSLKTLTLLSNSKTHQDEVILAKILHPDVRIFMQDLNFGTVEVVQGKEGECEVFFKPVDVNQKFDVSLKVLRKRSRM